ncbi:DUF3467 domain-containing protein [Rhodobacteraceae bacterium 2376]|uniref:DUF3467 domain-containing protein n=1 Tax=Rhabdonatronobacter sediminivivens TaxID=2743469 RepID=A0A7Z0I1U9_9RHOB|nr:DUF3467 domain-containing protein [Rhabdonatronobacter sediminivivens]NYS26009.1 DUF3467 domain-containing protein [Rhabdonatronobacter sediminivivens]
MSDQTNPKPETAEAGARRTPKVEWDDSKMRSTYANVVNAASTREEISVFFGTNQTWNLDEKREVTVQLSDRIIMSPFAAKRLWVLLGAVLKQHEQRFGTLAIDDGNRVPEVLSGGHKPN